VDLKSIYCAVRNESYVQVRLISIFKGRAMAQTLSCQPLIAEAWVRSTSIRVTIYGRRSGTGTDFFYK